MCLECDPLRMELERLRPKAREAGKLEMKLAEAHEHILAQTETQNATAKELAKLRRELSVENETSPTAKLVREVLDFWAETHPRANVSGQGARAKLVRQAVKLGHTEPMKPCPVHPVDGKPDKDARCTVADELKEALMYLRLKPFVGPKGRTAAAEPGCRLYDDIRYALANEKGVACEAKIEKCRREVRALSSMPLERVMVAFRMAQNVEQAYFRLVMDAMPANGNGNGNGGHA
jgi:hypothetical protein